MLSSRQSRIRTKTKDGALRPPASQRIRRAYIEGRVSIVDAGTERLMATRQIKLNAFMRPASIHTGAWRYPGAWPDMNFNYAHLKECIQKLEAAKFDAFFMADHMAVLNMPMDA